MGMRWLGEIKRYRGTLSSRGGWGIRGECEKGSMKIIPRLYRLSRGALRIGRHAEDNGTDRRRSASGKSGLAVAKEGSNLLTDDEAVLVVSL